MRKSAVQQYVNKTKSMHRDLDFIINIYPQFLYTNASSLDIIVYKNKIHSDLFLKDAYN